MRLLESKVSVVTGAARGIGKSISRTFLEHGSSVVIIDVDNEPLNETVDSFAKIGSVLDSAKVLGRVLDVSDHESFSGLVDEVVSTFGRVDILVNNAAIEVPASLFHCSMEEWNRMILTNLTAYFTCARIAAAKMVAGSVEGKIINISSIQSERSEEGNLVYATTKAGVEQLTRSLAIELAPYNILVNCIRPGFIKTRLSLKSDGVNETETEFFQQLYVKRRKIPLARAGEPDDVAKAALFFASDLCSYVTGASLPVDGGLSTTL